MSTDCHIFAACLDRPLYTSRCSIAFTDIPVTHGTIHIWRRLVACRLLCYAQQDRKVQNDISRYHRLHVPYV